MKLLMMIIMTMGLIGCSGGYEVEGLDDTEHQAYVSVAQSWREVCEDRFNEFMEYVEFTREQEIAECRRKFASGEETLPDIGIPDFPEEGF